MSILVENILRLLAIVGAFVLGGWIAGWVVQRVACALWMNQKLPDWTLWISRTLGGACLAVLVFLIAFGGGGSGIGGIGGLFSGGNQRGTTDGSAKDTPNTKDGEPKDVPKKSGSTGPTRLRVEVLGDRPLRRMVGDSFNPARRYRVEGVMELLTLEDLRQRIRDGLEADPPLGTLEIVLYNDSPTVGPVKELIAFARDIGADRLKVNEENLDQNAP
jgi:hypothetical protein